MQELIVIVAGLLLGSAASPIASRPLRAAAIIAGVAVIGTAWSRLVGEPEALALWDITQALLAAVAGLSLTRLATGRRLGPYGR